MASRSIIERCGTHCQTRDCSPTEVAEFLVRGLPSDFFAASGMRGTCCILMGLPHYKWALNSAVECHPHTVEVIGSNPIAPTINQPTLRTLPRVPCPEISSRIIFAGATFSSYRP